MVVPVTNLNVLAKLPNFSVSRCGLLIASCTGFFEIRSVSIGLFCKYSAITDMALFALVRGLAFWLVAESKLNNSSV